MAVYAFDILAADFGLAALVPAAAQTIVARVRPCGARASHLLPRLAAAPPAGLLLERDSAEGVWLLAGERGALEAAASAWAAATDPDVAALGTELPEAVRNAMSRPTWTTQIGARVLSWGQRTYVMGIVNVTPDSFSGDGLLASAGDVEAWGERAAEQALAFVAQGADIVDVGGESTRPGATAVDAPEELRRVIPAIRAIRRQSDAPISVDTFKAEVARAALDAGADMINDVWGLRMDPALGRLAAERGVPVVLMHNRSRPKDAALTERLGGRYVGVAYSDLVLDVLQELQAQVEQALAWGVARDRIIVDPGLGFGKTVEQNLALLARCDALRALGLPILLGPSRKSFIGYTLDLPPEERLHGTVASLAVAIAQGGVDIARVHDVGAAAQAARMADAIVAAGAYDAQA